MKPPNNRKLWSGVAIAAVTVALGSAYAQQSRHRHAARQLHAGRYHRARLDDHVAVVGGDRRSSGSTWPVSMSGTDPRAIAVTGVTMDRTSGAGTVRVEARARERRGTASPL